MSRFKYKERPFFGGEVKDMHRVHAAIDRIVYAWQQRYGDTYTAEAEAVVREELIRCAGIVLRESESIEEARAVVYRRAEALLSIDESLEWVAREAQVDLGKKPIYRFFSEQLDACIKRIRAKSRSRRIEHIETFAYAALKERLFFLLLPHLDLTGIDTTKMNDQIFAAVYQNGLQRLFDAFGPVETILDPEEAELQEVTYRLLEDMRILVQKTASYTPRSQVAA